MKTRKAPRWKKEVAGCYLLLFLVCLGSGVGSFVYFNRIWHRASPTRTETHSAALTSHGTTVFVTPGEMFWYVAMFRFAFGGAATLLALGVLLHLLGVPVSADPTEKEIQVLEKILHSAGLDESAGNIRQRMTRRSQPKSD